MASYWWIIGLIIVGVAILLIIPQTTAGRIIATLSLAGIVFGAYAFFMSANTQQRQLTLEEETRNNQYFSGIVGLFRDPEFIDEFDIIYGNDIDPQTFFLLTQIAQAIENLNLDYGYSEGRPGDPTWINVMKRWIRHPQFRLYWLQNKDQFDPGTDILVQMLLSNRI